MGKSSDASPVDAVQAIFSALEPLNAETRARVIVSALSLLGMSAPTNVQGAASAGTLSTQAPAATALAQTERRPMSLVELVQQKKPATNHQKIALFAYYREKSEGQTRFSRADLKTYFGKAREAPAANYDRDFTTAIRQGWIHEDGPESYLTSKGLEAVEAGFAGKGLPRGRAVTKKSSKKKRGTKK